MWHTATHYIWYMYAFKECVLQCVALQHKDMKCWTQSNLQHAATHCGTLQYTATHCDTLWHTATQCSTRANQYIQNTMFKHCNTLQHTAPHCTTLHHTVIHCNTTARSTRESVLQHTAPHCSTLQNTAAHCNTLQHTATHCNTLQHTSPNLQDPRGRACCCAPPSAVPHPLQTQPQRGHPLPENSQKSTRCQLYIRKFTIELILENILRTGAAVHVLKILKSQLDAKFAYEDSQ